MLFLEDPIHIASVLVQLIFTPEISLNDSNRLLLRNAEAEFSSANKAVVSSAYCSHLVSSLPMEIPFIFKFCLTETANTSSAKTNR